VLVSPSVTVSLSGEYSRTGDWSHRRLWMHSKSHFVSLYGFFLRVYIYILDEEHVDPETKQKPSKFRNKLWLVKLSPVTGRGGL
jgi:hypothetical protein